MESNSMNLTQFKFSVIYSVDTSQGVSLERLTPPDYAKLGWQCTERNATIDGYRYLGGVWAKGRHRKHCNILTFEQFCEFIDKVGLYVEKCQTGGSLGAPGYGFGWAPAVPFNGDETDVIQSAYVTPIPPEEAPEPTPALTGFPEDITDGSPWDWEEVEQEMWQWFDDGAWSAEKKAEEYLTTAEV